MTNLYPEHIAIIPPPPSRFTLNEWYLNNRLRNRTCLDQQQLADKVLTESERGREYTKEVTVSNRKEVDHKIQEKIVDIEFFKKEIVKQRKEVVIEIDNLILYNERIIDLLAMLRDNALPICEKCFIFRENRLGIDLCYDDVEIELHKESDSIRGSQALLKASLEQSNEQIRRLRSTIYFMDRDLEDKNTALKIEEHNLREIDENSLNLSCYHGFTPLDSANITIEEWSFFTRGNIERGAKEINGACSLRSYIDTILRQVVEDLVNQFNATNEAFRRRIEETKEAKTKLEVQHSEIHRQSNEMVRSLTEFERALADKEGFMGLAHTRLGNRAQRPSMELCRDLVETNLVNEVLELRNNCADLQTMTAEAKASLRYLLKTQIQLEEDINIKTNTLKIDEVDCMSLRQTLIIMDY